MESNGETNQKNQKKEQSTRKNEETGITKEVMRLGLDLAQRNLKEKKKMKLTESRGKEGRIYREYWGLANFNKDEILLRGDFGFNV